MERYIYALGYFDGVHRGHAALLDACRTLAARHHCKSGVVTFGNHPDALVLGAAPALLNTPQERERLLRTQVDTVITLPFDEALRNTPWQDFLRTLMEQYSAAGFVCGEDFRFGQRGAGTARLLEEFCREMPCAVVPQQTLDGTVVSSTHIRRLLEQGDMEQAVHFLGHPHVFSGTVVSGQALGRRLGIPTANLSLPAELAVPRFGVYACLAQVEGRKFMAVTNVGVRPTVSGQGVTVEPWLLDYRGDLYGKTLTLEFYAFLRPEQKFPSLEALRQEIFRNAQQTRTYFSAHSAP